jgi:hypothetical protein
MIYPTPSESRINVNVEPNSFKLPYIAAVVSFMAATLVASSFFLYPHLHWELKQGICGRMEICAMMST